MREIFALFVFILFPLTASAQLKHAPPSVRWGVRTLHFVDVIEANYQIQVNTYQKTVSATTELEFFLPKKGHAIIDLVPEASYVSIDGVETSMPEFTRDGLETTFRYVNKLLEPGRHTLVVKNTFDRYLRWNKNGSVSMGMWMTDLKDRSFLERYLPTSMEYDQYTMTLDLSVESPEFHRLRTNGEVIEKLGKNSWRVEYPRYFNCSSPFIHLHPSGEFVSFDGDYRASNGRIIPVEIYTKIGLKSFVDKTYKILKELEGDYGAWPHPRLVIYAVGAGGGMEYHGATITSTRALGHELLHSYFARGVMPSRGNAGWIDEAIASWRDKRYLPVPGILLRRSSLAAHSPHRRSTDDDAYTKGMLFVGNFEWRHRSRGGLKPFLSIFFHKYRFQTITTEVFRRELENYFGEDLKSRFQRYLYRAPLHNGSPAKTNPMHPPMSERELVDLL